MVGEDAEGKEIGGLLDENCVAGMGVEGAEQVEGGGGPGGDEQRVGVHGFTEFGR